MEHLDAQRDKNVIIPRALFMTTPNSFEDDIHKLENIYSHDEIIKVLQSTKETISNTTCRLVAERYHVPVFYRFAHPRRNDIHAAETR